MKHFLNKIFIVSGIFCLSFSLRAAEEKSTKEEYKLQQYEEIKKEQKKEFKRGVYKSTKKDYVNDWIGKDINYQKKVIKLKKDYRDWVIDKIKNKQSVRFKDYEPLKLMTRVEKQILSEYHNMLFEKQKQQKPVNRRKKRIKQTQPEKKPAEKNNNTSIKTDNKIQAIPEEIPADNAENEYFYYILLGIAGILIIISAIFLIKKYRNQE
ncbi:MAG: hypothetical protein JW864_12825 [Spirochaetes bacterium]|nr:hypothetical protein [Spirochaetota bacterium]